MLLLIFVDTDLLELGPGGEEAEHLRQITVNIFDLRAETEFLLLLLGLAGGLLVLRYASLDIVVQLAAFDFSELVEVELEALLLLDLLRRQTLLHNRSNTA